MNCPRCGAALYPGSTFCGSCQLPLQPPPAHPANAPAPMYRNAPQPSAPQAPYYPSQGGARPVSGPPLSQPLAPQAPYYPPQNSPQRSQPYIAQAPRVAGPPPHVQVAETPRPALAEQPEGKTTRHEKQEEKEESQNERLMIFSDAVIAFAITIAAIPLKVPKFVSCPNFLPRNLIRN